MSNYRIKKANGTYKNAGTDLPSWFTLARAIEIVDREAGETIWEFNPAVDPSRPMWEIL